MKAKLLYVLAAVVVLIVSEPAAHASSKGRRNTAIGLGALALFELSRGHTDAAILAGAGAGYAYKRYQDKRRWEDKQYRGYDDRYDRPHVERYDRHNGYRNVRYYPGQGPGSVLYYPPSDNNYPVQGQGSVLYYPPPDNNYPAQGPGSVLYYPPTSATGYYPVAQPQRCRPTRRTYYRVQTQTQYVPVYSSPSSRYHTSYQSRRPCRTRHMYRSSRPIRVKRTVIVRKEWVTYN